jgi:hypothetical protein
MLSPNDARITGISCIEPASGSSAGVVAAGSAFMVVMSVEAGAAIFSTGARFCAGLQAEGLEARPGGRLEGHLCDETWPGPIAQLRFQIVGELTDHLADRVLALVGFLRINAAPPYLVSTARAGDIFVAPAPAVRRTAPREADGRATALGQRPGGEAVGTPASPT